MAALPAPEHNPCAPEEELMALLTHDVLRSRLELVSKLGQDALLNTLVPHRQLPLFDPAAYIIAHHAQRPMQEVGIQDINDSYDLGVVFGRLLVVKALNDNQPVIHNFNPQYIKVVDAYLDASSTSRGVLLPPSTSQENTLEIKRAFGLFAARCKSEVPHLMLSGAHALQHGFGDYLNVVSIVTAEETQIDGAFWRATARLLPPPEA